MQSSYFLLFLLVMPVFVFGQDAETIRLYNPSFEDVPKHSDPPRGWSDCGAPGESPPDVHPTPQFNVLRPAFKGNTYLGMVTRDNDTWEAVTQRLPSPIVANQCYEFSIYLCRSDTYTSATRANPQGEYKFTEPVKLRVWGSSGYCEKRELLAESSPVKNVQWQKFEFKFEPSNTHQYIILEAFYKTPVLFPYNGNLLLDNASDIVPISCDDPQKEALIAVMEEPSRPATKATKNIAKEESQIIVTKANNRKIDEKPRLDIKRDNLKRGSTFAIDNLYFEADSTNIPEVCFPVLDEIYSFMKENSDIIIEIGGHTNSIPSHEYCNKLSLARAKSVANYIIEKGIPARRVFYKGYGKTKPIADDSTMEGKKKNQRVEIRVLYMNK